ncbi:hypothetical protein PINS_up011768 [Pythium insidiosum]|nr:hypothetical protein PINS_up011768 [Pythium insidiosum]
MFPSEYVFGLPLTKELKDSIQERTRQQLSEMLGVEVDNVMAEYVVVMIGNNKSMSQIAHDLVDFIGDEHAQQFVAWLSVTLKTLEGANETTTAPPATTEDEELDALAPPSAESDVKVTSDDSSSASSSRVVNLKGIGGGSSAGEKKTVVLSGSSGASGTVRSLNRGSADMQDVLARRSQRFGLPTPTEAPKSKQDGQGKRGARDTNDKPKNGGVKRKNDGESGEEAQPAKRPGSASRVARLLGPPVNTDQAELDARDGGSSNKRKKNGRDDRNNRKRSGSESRQEQENQSDGDSNGRRSTRRRTDGGNDRSSADGSTPPLPPNSPRDDRRSDNRRRDQRDGRGGPTPPPHHFGGPGFRGPPGFGGPYPPPPYGMYYPPPYGMPPYGMGFPPHQGMPRGPYAPPPMPPGGQKPHYQPRGPRPSFQNRKWVNPNVAKAEGEGAPSEGDTPQEGSNETPAQDAAADGSQLNVKAAPFMPRNPYYSSQMRPRFQNKTWVRPDATPEPTAKDDQDLSASLPTTPPPEDVNAA